MKLVVVESPAKAKTLKNYLGDNYVVAASIGHFRDLPKSGIGVEEINDNFYVKKWELESEKINPIIKLVKKSDTIFLATDPDREGELIAWHLFEVCKEQKITDKKKFLRIEFNQVNKETILKAINNPREIDNNLVNAALARRFLDRFFGYKISPITKRRTIFGSSAGRVQSPALRILSEREKEIDLFKPEEFWEIFLKLENIDKSNANFKLTEFMDKKIGRLSIKSKEQSQSIVNVLKDEKFIISSVDRKRKQRKPNAPFSTSTLQQDASNRLNFSPSLTNSLAQQLFDGATTKGGLITYIRTDSITLSNESINQCRGYIQENLDKNYLPTSPNIFKTKSKIAQEAHEPIRPIKIESTPSDVKKFLNDNQYKLYKLIWDRTVASQMNPQLVEETVINVKSKNSKLRVSGTTEIFDGFRKIYASSGNKNEIETNLPIFKDQQNLNFLEFECNQHFTKPPNRFSEAGLIKKLEELGIGRPSTYASIILKLKQKSYVYMKSKSLVPNSKGRTLSKFLEKYFFDFVEYKFTAELEEQLDKVTTKSFDWKDLLKKFLRQLNDRVSDVEKFSITEVIEEINKLSKEFDIKTNCPKCSNGNLTIKFAFNGPFIGCSEYKKEKNGCNYTQSLENTNSEDDIEGGEKNLGNHPETNKNIKIKKGRYGPYIELEGDAKEDKKPKRTSIPKNVSIKDIDLDYAVNLLKLPRIVGEYPENGKIISASIGPYGPYLKYNNRFISLKNDDVLEININRAVDVIKDWEEKNKEYEIGVEPKSKQKIILKKGRYGHFLEISINKQKERYSIPKNLEIKEVDIEKALEIIHAKKETKQKITKKKK